MTDRPEWVTCVAKRNGRQTWCSRVVAEFVFQDWDHAVLNAYNEGRLTVCPDCLRAVVHLLENQ